MSTQSILGRARHRGTARTLRHHTSGSESHHAASKRALSKGRWGTGGGKGNCQPSGESAQGQAGQPQRCARKGGAQFHQGEGGESAQVPWHHEMPPSQMPTGQNAAEHEIQPSKRAHQGEPRTMHKELPQWKHEVTARQHQWGQKIALRSV